MFLLKQAKDKKIFLILSLLILAIGLLALFYSPVLFQEGNPWPQLKGIVQLNLGNENVVKLDIGENKYITKNDNPEIIKSFMGDKGYEFTEQMGSGYLFKSVTGASAVATHRYYSRYYSLWTIAEQTNESVEPSHDDLWTATTTSAGLTFNYPSEWLAKYISQVNWPPQVTMENQQFICNPSASEIEQGGQTELRTVDNRPYCLTKASEGAAGSAYTTYTYKFPRGNQSGVVAFTLRFVQCQNYDEPKAAECESERSSFDIDGLADRIAQSLIIRPEQESIVDQLKDCLPKSDVASQEKCNQLLQQINDYDACVNAGFSIMKANPPQCATPDGRIFIENKR